MIANSRAGIPLYMQVKEYLAELIHEELEPGDMLPNQAQISEKTGTSMITVKRAIKELELEGKIECRGGRRATVRRETALDNSQGVSSWADTVSGLGHKPSTDWCQIREITPEPRVARLLNLKRAEKTIVVNRLRSLNGVPIAVSRNELPANLAKGLDERGLSKESLYEELQTNYGWKPVYADEEISARKATSEERKHLGKKVDIVLVMSRVTYGPGDQPIENSELILPANRYRYRTQLRCEAEAALAMSA